MEDDKNQMTMSCDMGMKMKVVESNRKAQKSKYISISYEIILRTPCMVYTMKQLPQIIGTSSSTCMLCLQVNLQSLIRKRFLYLSVRWNNVEPTPTIKKSQWRISNLEIVLRLYYHLPSHIFILLKLHCLPPHTFILLRLTRHPPYTFMTSLTNTCLFSKPSLLTLKIPLHARTVCCLMRCCFVIGL